MPFRKQKKPTGLMALAGETAKMAQNMLVLDKTEAALEKEMEKEEKRVKPKTKIGKIRRRGAHLIHGKYLLLMVVILNVLDCLLVLGNLMLDIKYVTDLLTEEYAQSEEFIGAMKNLYPIRLGYLGPEDFNSLEHEILTATLTWNSSGTSDHGDKHGTSPGINAHQSTSSFVPSTPAVPPTFSSASTNANVRKRRASAGQDPAINSNKTDPGTSEHHGEDDHAHSVEVDVAHGLHKASIVILAILTVETFFKVFCLGREMLEHKLECFDGFIVIASFIVDLVFLKGLQQFTVQEFVLIMAFMVPWRIIRVVNSLVVAIMDHEHFRLVLLYKQKKKVSNELKEIKDENKGLEACIDALKKMCADAGLPEQLVTAKLSMYRKVKAKTNALGAMSNFAMGGSNMNKPFTVGIMSSPNIIVTDETQSKQAKQLEDVLSEKSGVSPTGIDAIGKDEITKSHSATSLNSLCDPLNLLAENSASFITTMNKDGVSDAEANDYKKRVDAASGDRPTSSRAEADDQTDGSETSESSTADSFDSKNKTDKEGLVKDNEDGGDRNLQGFDNPTSRL